MKFKDLSEEVKKIWKVAIIVKIANGATLGLVFFTWGPLIYEKSVSLSAEKTAILVTTILIGIINGLRVLLEVPTGAIGDAIGRKWSIVWSFVFEAIDYMLLALIPFANSLAVVVLLGFLSVFSYGISYTLFSGSFTAWCVDQMREKAPNIGYEQLFSLTYTFRYLSAALGGVVGILLYLWGAAYIALLMAAAMSTFALVYCIGKMEDEESIQYISWEKASVSNITKRMGEILGTGFEVFQKSTIILLLVLIFASFMFVMNIVDYLWPVYLRSNLDSNMQPYYWIGLALTTLLMSALGSYALNLWSKKRHKENGIKAHNIILRRVFVFSSLLASLPILYLSLATKYGSLAFPEFVIAILVVCFFAGIIPPCFETLVNNYIPDTHASERATILSFGSLARSLMIMLLAIPAGGSSGKTTTTGWIIPALLLLFSAIIGNFFLKRKQDRVTDVIKNRVEPISNLTEGKKEPS